MPRIRYLKPEFFSDEDLAELKYEARLTFAGLWCYADKAGRLEDRPKFLKAMIFPYDNVDIEKQLQSLAIKPFIVRYEAEGRRLIEIVNWDKHQKPHHTEADSKFPPTPPLKEKGMEKGMGMGMEKQLNPSAPTNNVQITVKDPLEIESVDKSDTSDSFDTFWDIYPSRNGKKLYKQNTQDYFLKIKPSDISLVIQATKNYASSEMIKKGIGIKDPIRFLKKEVWREWIEPEQPRNNLSGLQEWADEIEEEENGGKGQKAISSSHGSAGDGL